MGMNEPWAENVVFISECYSEKYPTGKRNYEMIDFGPVTENCFLYLPEKISQEEKDKLIMERRKEMHDRLVKSVTEMVNTAIKSGRLVGVSPR